MLGQKAFNGVQSHILRMLVLFFVVFSKASIDEAGHIVMAAGGTFPLQVGLL